MKRVALGKKGIITFSLMQNEIRDWFIWNWFRFVIDSVTTERTLCEGHPGDGIVRVKGARSHHDLVTSPGTCEGKQCQDGSAGSGGSRRRVRERCRPGEDNRAEWRLLSVGATTRLLRQVYSTMLKKRIRNKLTDELESGGGAWRTFRYPQKPLLNRSSGADGDQKVAFSAIITLRVEYRLLLCLRLASASVATGSPVYV